MNHKHSTSSPKSYLRSGRPGPLEFAHILIRDAVKTGDTVIDATMGNGHDTVFLASLVGPEGEVIGFDIQEKALETTRERLKHCRFAHPHIKLHLASHGDMKEYVREAPQAIMFNLGYLPGSDKVVKTSTPETLRALRSSVEIVKQGGLITVMCYPGHPGGEEESVKVRGFLSKLPVEQWQVMEFGPLNRESAPFLIAAWKK